MQYFDLSCTWRYKLKKSLYRPKELLDHKLLDLCAVSKFSDLFVSFVVSFYVD